MGHLFVLGCTVEDDNSFSLPQLVKKTEIFSPIFFPILKEPLIVQKQTVHQKKALNLSFLVPEANWRGTIERAPRLLVVKNIFQFFAVMKMEDAQ